MMKNDSTSTKANDAASQKPAAAPANERKSGDVQTKHQSAERGSLPGERAEGEGMIAPDPEADSKVEGEGSYTATRAYDEGVERTVASGQTEELGKKAAAALDGPEGAELRKAEQVAKQGKST